MIIRIAYFFCFFNLVFCISKHPLVLVVSIDAFGHQFMNENDTPYLHSLSRLGTSADYIRNVFPTKTFTNHMAIGTGLYAEDHGVLANEVFFNGSQHKYGYDLFHYNEDIVPIWTLNEKAGDGRHSGSMMWPGANYPYQNVTPTHVHPFAEDDNHNQRVDTIISWFLNDTTPANLVMFYFTRLDYVGHRYGVNHSYFKEKIGVVDKLAKYLMERLEAEGLKDKINVILTSDHGLVSVNRDHMIDLRNFVDQSKFNITGTSPVFQINAIPSLQSHVKQDMIDKTYSALSKEMVKNGHFKVYLKDGIPESYHYKNNSRVSDIIVVAESGYGFQDLIDAFSWYEKHENMIFQPGHEFGVHGYANDTDMFPVFIAVGPGIKRNFSIPPFDNVDLYHLFASLLKLDLPSPTTGYQLRGQIDHVSAMLQNDNLNATEQTGAPSVSKQIGVTSVSEQTGAPSISAQAGAQSVMRQTGASSVSEQTGAPSVLEQNDTQSVMRQTGASGVSEQIATPKVTVQTGAPSVAEQSDAANITKNASIPNVEVQVPKSGYQVLSSSFLVLCSAYFLPCLIL